ncbi:Aliphatic sulfonates import ATP-binding protein SsuB [bacterium HR32]|jgi:NitT/TauT family transport system ATP-binding protein|nr:Aliphatic sulfonates import ATP-binding protein SsuB [bacterium HR32]
MSLRVESLSLRYATGVEVLRDVSLEVAAGEFVSVVGPSGCGKSTLLNVVAGLVDRRGDVDRSGRITWNGREIRTASDWAGQLGYVFQRDTLLPWFTLEQNVELGLRVRGVPREGRERRVRELVRTVGLAGFEHVFPHQLSGGMRQRAQLLRTLAYDPQVVLMDEPFGALDAHTRLGLQREVTETWSGLRNTVLFVTHDLSEAIVMAQRVVLLSHRPGRVVRVYEVPFGYPRDPIELQGRREFALLYAEIWQGLAREFRAQDSQQVRAAARV